MTATLTVPADVWACKQPGVPLVAAIVEGEYLPCPMCNDTGMGRHGDGFCHSCPMDPEPPAWLVALRDARCGCACHVVAPAQGVHCSDHCHDGRLLHDVRVEMIPYSHHGDPCPCGLPADEHYRTVRCLVDVVPVVSPDVWGPMDDRPVLLVSEPHHAIRLMTDGPPKNPALTTAHVDALAAACGKPPADWVGGYAVVLTTTDQGDE